MVPTSAATAHYSASTSVFKSSSKEFMESISKADKEVLHNFLCNQLLPFISDENTPTDNLNSPTHNTQKELEGLFFGAFE